MGDLGDSPKYISEGRSAIRPPRYVGEALKLEGLGRLWIWNRGLTCHVLVSKGKQSLTGWPEVAVSSSALPVAGRGKL